MTPRLAAGLLTSLRTTGTRTAMIVANAYSNLQGLIADTASSGAVLRGCTAAAFRKGAARADGMLRPARAARAHSVLRPARAARAHGVLRPARGTAVLLAALSLLSCSRAIGPMQPLPPAPTGMADEAWVQATLARMSLEERVGQMLMVHLSGGFENVRGAAMSEAFRLVGEAYVGGFVVGLGSPLDVAVRLNELQGVSRLPLLIAADLEWGSGMRLWRPVYLPYGTEGRGGTVFPFNMGIAATGEPLLAELAGRITGVEARAVGIHWVFAPVVDVNTAAANPIVNVRAYSSDPMQVGLYASSFIRGARAGGVLTSAKHFPGHGDTDVDSHVSLPVLRVDSATLFSRELCPFRLAISAGVSSVMLGHIAVPALTQGMNTPATLSPELATGLLRGQMGFRGLIVTDAMTMGALRDIPGYSPAELVLRAVEAGADVVLSPPDPFLAHRALVSAVRSGRIHYSRVDSSVVRILRAKAEVGLHRGRLVELENVSRVVASPEHEIVAADIAARSMTLARDSGSLLPLDPRRVRDLFVVAYSAPGDVRAGAALAAELRAIYGSGVSFMRIDEQTSDAARDSAWMRARQAEATIMATFLMPISGQGHLSVPPDAHRLAAQLRAASRRMMVVSFGDPYGPATLPGSSTYLLAWQPRGDAAQRAAARAIAGRAPTPGRLPIELPPMPVASGLDRPALHFALELAEPADVGMDAALLALVDSIVIWHVDNGATPGAALAVGRRGGLVRLSGYGTLDRRPGFGVVTDSTLYDMASITKVVATTTAVMMLVDDGVLSLDDPVRKHLPEWRGSEAKQRVTLRNLLLHNSGLASYGPLWRDLRGREQYRSRITAMSLEYEPGTRTVYSDFGIILLALIAEQASGRTLDVFLRERLFNPLGMRDTGFNPLQWPYGMMMLAVDEPVRSPPEPLMPRIAPTEVDTVFRMRHVRGQVHDENAFALGGVAGHAGLFSSARDMAIFAQLMLNRGYYGGRRYIDPATVDLFTRRAAPGSSRALGWDTPEGNSSAGSLFSAASFGHTGFTGTSIWVDPEQDVFVVLLTNRVNPTRDNQRQAAMRRDVADAVQRAIIDRR
jgi:beta-N-acetylhexosaminidase